MVFKEPDLLTRCQLLVVVFLLFDNSNIHFFMSTDSVFLCVITIWLLGLQLQVVEPLFSRLGREDSWLAIYSVLGSSPLGFEASCFSVRVVPSELVVRVD
jgi:hypothetical protein